MEGDVSPGYQCRPILRTLLLRVLRQARAEVSDDCSSVFVAASRIAEVQEEPVFNARRVKHEINPFTRSIDGACNVFWASILMLVFGVSDYPYLIGAPLWLGATPLLLGRRRVLASPTSPSASEWTALEIDTKERGMPRASRSALRDSTSVTAPSTSTTIEGRGSLVERLRSYP